MPRPRKILPKKRDRQQPLAEGTGALRVLDFLTRNTRLELLPWQRAVIEGIFAEQGGRRPVRTAYVSVPRLNGKSTLAAGIAAYELFDVLKAHVLVVASDTAQATDIIFKAVADLVRESPTLSKLAVIQRREILVPSRGARLQVIPADAEGAHGYHPTAVLFDELHTQPKRDLWDVLSTGMVQGGLLVALTTAGYDRTTICFEQYSYATKWLAGVVRDEGYFAWIVEASAEADWTLPATWQFANPALGRTIREEYFAEEVRRALEMPAAQNTFRRLHLNQWTEQSTRFFDQRVWTENAGPPIDESALHGRRCFGGLDMSTSQDLTAWVLVFPNGTDPDEILVLPRFWCPEARLRDTRNRFAASYEAWARAGFLRTTPGESIDYAFVRQAILDDFERFRFVDAAVDVNFQGYQLGLELQQAGLPIVTMRTGSYTMSPPMKELERRLILRKVHHGGNPVLRWMADNLAVKTDHLGNIVPDKASSQGKIDGIVALVMALDRVMRHTNASPRSVYDTRGILTL